MIVKIAAFLYILQAALCLASFGVLPFGFSASMETLATLLVSGLLGAIGFGLLKRQPWARWLALGNSLLGWTLGSLMFIALVAVLVLMRSLVSAMFGYQLGAAFGFIMLVIGVFFIASIVISFKLYFHLRSEAGAREFGVEVEPFTSVCGSVGTWLVIGVVNGMMSGGSADSFSLPGSEDDFGQVAADSIEYQQKEQRRREEGYERERLEARQLESERLEAERLAQMEDSSASAPEETHMVDEAPLPAIQSATTASVDESESGQTSRNQILKCRDASGAMQYTQGYCPPGTTRVEMPNN